MPSRGGFSSRGGARSGRGRGGSVAPKERSASRDATSLTAIFSKNTRYDHRVAKEKDFWEKSKKLRSYHRMMKKEGIERDDVPRVKRGAHQQHDGDEGDEEMAPRVDLTPASYVPSTALRAADPNQVFSVGPALDAFARAPQNRPKKEKRKRDEADGSAAAGGAGADAGAASSVVGASGRAALPAGPDFKKARRLTPGQVAALREEKKKAWADKQRRVVDQQAKRKERHTLLTEKTDRGQPKLNNQMQHLLEKLQKQAAATTPKK